MIISMLLPSDLYDINFDQSQFSGVNHVDQYWSVYTLYLCYIKGTRDFYLLLDSMNTEDNVGSDLLVMLDQRR